MQGEQQISTTSSSISPKAAGVVHIEYLESGAAVLLLGAPEERVVTLTVERMRSLKAAIAEVAQKRPHGLIIIGPHADMFTAGADISLIGSLTDPQAAEAMAREGQEIFSAIENLPFVTVAAISGPCVGGGCELALACRVRLITDQKSSIIGLPEIKLGILPGFGGTQRLPRLIGLPKALDIILAGKTIRPSQARARGLVHEVMSYDSLRKRAEQIALGLVTPQCNKPSLVDRVLTNTSWGRSIVRRNAEKTVQRETKGFYPAPVAALSSSLVGLEQGLHTGYKYEAKELGRLVVTPESKSLVRIFGLTESAKSLGKSGRKLVEHLHAVVVGAGVMGAGIAGSLARADCSVILKDTNDEALARGIQHIRTQLSRISYLSETDRSFIMNRVESTTRDSPNLGNVHFAIEAIVEEMGAKKKVLGDLAKLLPPDAIIASNTSSLSVSEIAAVIENPERVIGMHFFNPVEKMPLVEIVRGARTSAKAIAIVAALTTKLGKFPIVVEDVPGFLVNRILSPYISEAAHMLSEGYAVEDIDSAALEFGMPMGPLRLLDEVGLDVAAHVAEIMVRGYGERMQGPPLVTKLLAAGRKGRKSGAGFYDFSGDDCQPHRELRTLLGIAVPAVTSPARPAIAERLISRLINEAVQCLDEGVAGMAGPEAASQVDLGTVMGMGFPPFRGGLLYYAQSLGAKRINEILSALSQRHGSRFAPWKGISARAESGKSFFEAA